MVLDDVADRPHVVVEAAAAGYTEVFGHCDLDALDEAAVPHRLEDRVREPEDEQILDGLPPKLVVDPEDGVLGEVSAQAAVEFLGRRKVASEGLLHDHPTTFDEFRRCKAIDDVVEQGRRDREVEERIGRPSSV